MKEEKNVEVEASSRFLTPLQIQKMAEMRYNVAAHIKIEVEGDNFYASVLQSRGVEFEGLPSWGNFEQARINVETMHEQQIVLVLHDNFVLKFQPFAIYREGRPYQFLVSFERNGSEGIFVHFYRQNGGLRGFGRLEAKGYTSNLGEVSNENSSLEFVPEEKILRVPFDPGGNYVGATDCPYHYIACMKSGRYLSTFRRELVSQIYNGALLKCLFASGLVNGKIRIWNMRFERSSAAIIKEYKAGIQIDRQLIRTSLGQLFHLHY